MRQFLLLIIFFLVLSGGSVYAAAKCYLQFPDGYKTDLDKFSSKYTTDNFNDYIRYTDDTGSRFLNVRSPEEQGYELHMVTVDRGEPNLIVKPSKKPLVLFLGSNNVSKWAVNIEDGAFIKRVYLAYSDDIPEIEGLPDDIEIKKFVFRKRMEKKKYVNCSIVLEWEAKAFSGLHNEEWKNYKWEVGPKVGLVETSYNSYFNPKENIIIPFDPLLYTRNDIIVNDKFFNMSDAQALSFYRDSVTKAKEPFKKNIDMLISLMEEGKLPILYPVKGNLKYFTPLQFNPDQYEHSSPADDIFYIEATDNVIESGSGDDVIKGREGVRGNYSMVENRTIYIFQENWGNDRFETKCTGHARSNLVPSNGKEFWQNNGFEYSNLFVFGPNIYPEDMGWDGPFKIVNKKTGDSIEFVGIDNRFPSWCGHFIFVEEGVFRTFNWADFYDNL